MFGKSPKGPEFNPEYDDEPVLYCKDCHSLLIQCDEDAADTEWDGLYCGTCGSTDIGSCSIEEWLAEEERLYRQDTDC